MTAVAVAASVVAVVTVSVPPAWIVVEVNPEQAMAATRASG
jgi:hypothetical protein